MAKTLLFTGRAGLAPPRRSILFTVMSPAGKRTREASWNRRPFAHERTQGHHRAPRPTPAFPQTVRRRRPRIGLIGWDTTPEENLGAALVFFFDLTDGATRIIPGDPGEFVCNSARRWREQFRLASDPKEFLAKMPEEMPPNAVFISYASEDLTAACHLGPDPRWGARVAGQAPAEGGGELRA